ncbi:MAG: hypothetical protein Kilf2KO_31450 [Rhodospirillales bacterium]
MLAVAAGAAGFAVGAAGFAAAVPAAFLGAAVVFFTLAVDFPAPVVVLRVVLAMTAPIEFLSVPVRVAPAQAAQREGCSRPAMDLSSALYWKGPFGGKRSGGGQEVTSAR